MGEDSGEISFALKNFCDLNQIIRVRFNTGSVSVDVDFNQNRAGDFSFFAVTAELLGCFLVV